MNFNRIGMPSVLRDANTGTGTGGDQWYTTAQVPAETVGHWQNKGWDISSPDKVALAATKAHQEAERLIGVRADHDLVAVPKDPSKGDMNAVWTRLGKPADAKEYEFTGITRKDGKEAPAPLLDSIRTAAFAANLPKQAAPDIAKAVIGYLDQIDAANAAETSAKVVEERTALAKSWNTTPEKLQGSPQMLVAQNAIRALGSALGDGGPAKLLAAVNALENSVGYSSVMSLFHTIGAKIGEDPFHTGDGQVNTGVMSVEQAQARKTELMRDSAWVTKYRNGDREAMREMLALNTLIVGSSQ